MAFEKMFIGEYGHAVGSAFEVHGGLTYWVKIGVYDSC